MRLFVLSIILFSISFSSCKKDKTEYEVRVEYSHEVSNNRISTQSVFLNDVERNPNSGDYGYIFDAKAGDELYLHVSAGCFLVNNVVDCYYLTMKIYIDNDLYKTYRKKTSSFYETLILPTL